LVGNNKYLPIGYELVLHDGKRDDLRFVFMRERKLTKTALIFQIIDNKC
jgi:hypothetical protein